MQRRLDHFVGRKVEKISRGTVTLEGDVRIYAGQKRTPKIPKLENLYFITVIQDADQTQMVLNTLENNQLGNNEWRIPIATEDLPTVRIETDGETWHLDDLMEEDDFPPHPDEREATGPDEEYFASLDKEDEEILEGQRRLREENAKEEEEFRLRQEEADRQAQELLEEAEE